MTDCEFVEGIKALRDKYGVGLTYLNELRRVLGNDLEAIERNIGKDAATVRMDLLERRIEILENPGKGLFSG